MVPPAGSGVAEAESGAARAARRPAARSASAARAGPGSGSRGRPPRGARAGADRRRWHPPSCGRRARWRPPSTSPARGPRRRSTGWDRRPAVPSGHAGPAYTRLTLARSSGGAAASSVTTRSAGLSESVSPGGGAATATTGRPLVELPRSRVPSAATGTRSEPAASAATATCSWTTMRSPWGKSAWASTAMIDGYGSTAVRSWSGRTCRVVMSRAAPSRAARTRGASVPLRPVTLTWSTATSPSRAARASHRPAAPGRTRSPRRRERAGGGAAATTRAGASGCVLRRGRADPYPEAPCA